MNLRFIRAMKEVSVISNMSVNEEIRVKEIRVIGVDNEQLGIMSPKEGMAHAEEAGLDLVMVSPQANPPVCKIIDYGKYRYELARKEKESKKKQKVIEVKELRMSPNIDTHDLETRKRQAEKFLEKGNKVKVTLRFRGREMAHMNGSRYILEEFAQSLSSIAELDKPIKVEGRNMAMILKKK